MFTIIERLIRQLRQVAKKNYCPLYIDWSFGFSPDPGVQLRRCASRHHFYRYAFPIRWGVRSLMIARWPLRIPFFIWRSLDRFGNYVAQQHKVPRWRQLVELSWFAFTRFIHPTDYYHYQFYRPEQRQLIDQYLYLGDALSLFAYLNHYEQHIAIDDKEAFALLCAKVGLPTVPLLAVCKAGQVTWQTERKAEAEDEIFAKPAYGARGEGTMLWRRLDNDHYQDQQGKLLAWAEVVKFFEELSQTKTYLLQPRLRNHDAINALSPGALNTVRIVTGRSLAGCIEVIVATFKMARSNRITNTHSLNSPVDLNNGRLGMASSYSPICPGYDVHPDTGASITGQTLPDWQAVMRLAQQAHQHFPSYAFLGWDVALTPAGPLLLEGNAGWDVLTVQKPQRIPLARTRFAAICLERIEHWGRSGRKHAEERDYAS